MLPLWKYFLPIRVYGGECIGHESNLAKGENTSNNESFLEKNIFFLVRNWGVPQEQGEWWIMLV